MKLNEFMFLISVRVRSSSEPTGRTETLASTRSVPFSISASEMPELDDGLAQELEEALRLVGRTDVRRGDDLDQRRAAPVVVDERGVGAADTAGAAADMDGLRRVLLEVCADDSDHTVAVRSG